MKRIIFPMITFILIGLVGLVIAFATTTSQNSTHIVHYEITKPGWHLLPNCFSETDCISELDESEMTSTDIDKFFESFSHRFLFSPFSKEYTNCRITESMSTIEKNDVCFQGNAVENIYGVSIEFLESLSSEDLKKEYLAFTRLSADWYYFSQPTELTYSINPFFLDFDYRGFDDIGLFGTKLKTGWNLIMYPPHLAFQDVELGDCSIGKMYVFDDISQSWTLIPEEEYVDGELSGVGIAIKVTNDCTFLAEKGSSVSTPPLIPN